MTRAEATDKQMPRDEAAAAAEATKAAAEEVAAAAAEAVKAAAEEAAATAEAARLAKQQAAKHIGDAEEPDSCPASAWPSHAWDTNASWHTRDASYRNRWGTWW